MEDSGDSWILAPVPVEASYRGWDDNGQHDPDEVSDGEGEDDDPPTWF